MEKKSADEAAEALRISQEKARLEEANFLLTNTRKAQKEIFILKGGVKAPNHRHWSDESQVLKHGLKPSSVLGIQPMTEPDTDPSMFETETAKTIIRLATKFYQECEHFVCNECTKQLLGDGTEVWCGICLLTPFCSKECKSKGMRAHTATCTYHPAWVTPEHFVQGTDINRDLKNNNNRMNPDIMTEAEDRYTFVWDTARERQYVDLLPEKNLQRAQEGLALMTAREKGKSSLVEEGEESWCRFIRVPFPDFTPSNIRVDFATTDQTLTEERDRQVKFTNRSLLSKEKEGSLAREFTHNNRTRAQISMIFGNKYELEDGSQSKWQSRTDPTEMSDAQLEKGFGNFSIKDVPASQVPRVELADVPGNRGGFKDCYDEPINGTKQFFSTNYPFTSAVAQAAGPEAIYEESMARWIRSRTARRNRKEETQTLETTALRAIGESNSVIWMEKHKIL
jgi:hypothetical protein